jgi:hypothetical protein
MTTEQVVIDWAAIGWQIVDWGVPFAIGVLFRKKVANFFIKLKKLAFNDYLEVNLLAVREYQPTSIKEVSLEVFDAIRPKIADMRLISHNARSMIVAVPEFSSNLILAIDSQFEDEDQNESQDDRIIKMSLRTENPLGIGARDIAKRVSQFERDVEIIFETIEKMAFIEHKPLKNSYAVCDLSRIGRFKEEKNFDIEDKRLHARVIAAGDQLTITTSPIDKVLQKNTDLLKESHFHKEEFRVQ